MQSVNKGPYANKERVAQYVLAMQVELYKLA